jgi:hypothetical protein
VLGEDLDPFTRRAGKDTETRGPQPDLTRRFLPGRIQDARRAQVRPGQAGRRLEQESRLADSWFPAEEDQRAWYQPTTEHAIEFADPEGQPRKVHLRDVRETRRLRRAGDPTRDGSFRP